MSVDVSIIGPALLAGLLVLSTHVPLGREVLQRGIIFIDLAVAQIAGLGVIASQLYGSHLHGWHIQLAAFSAALAGSILLGLAERKLKRQQEALIGITFVLAATGGILLLANDPHGGEQLKDLLSGQILWVDSEDLLPAAMISLSILLLMRFIRPGGNRLWFYVLFAGSVTVSVQLVGVYLVFASLIIPVFFSRLAGHDGLLIPYVIGVQGYIAGLVISAATDLPAGPLIVWMQALLGFSLLLLPSSLRSENQ